MNADETEPPKLLPLHRTRSPLLCAMENLTKAPNLHPETKRLLALAIEAQETGEMPDLFILTRTP